MGSGATVRIVVGYQLQCAVLENGWPQTGRGISGALGRTEAKDKGNGKGGPAKTGDHPTRSPEHYNSSRDHER
eukprot:4447342-Pyramimonas_sp.AAC.1